MKNISAVLSALVVCAMVGESFASVTATLTADNRYALYYGKVDGQDLAFVGQNEQTSTGNPGTYNWSVPETWPFDGQDYLYVVAWDDKSVAQMWIGEFLLPDSTWLYSNKTEWEFFVADKSANPGVAFDASTAAFATDVAANIADATSGSAWAAPLAEAPNGTSPWGTIPNFHSGSEAKFLWHDIFGNPSTSDNHYVIFRITDPIDLSDPRVPEPGTLAIWSIFGAGAAGVSAARRRRQRGWSAGSRQAIYRMIERGV